MTLQKFLSFFWPRFLLFVEMIEISREEEESFSFLSYLFINYNSYILFFFFTLSFCMFFHSLTHSLTACQNFRSSSMFFLTKLQRLHINFSVTTISFHGEQCFNFYEALNLHALLSFYCIFRIFFWLDVKVNIVKNTYKYENFKDRSVQGLSLLD